MNNLQKLINLRGVSVAKMAEAIGIGYHSVQKTVKGHRETPYIRQRIADYLGFTPELIWGVKSDAFLVRQIRLEIDRRAESERKRLSACYLEKNAQAIQ